VHIVSYSALVAALLFFTSKSDFRDLAISVLNLNPIDSVLIVLGVIKPSYYDTLTVYL